MDILERELESAYSTYLSRRSRRRRAGRLAAVAATALLVTAGAAFGAAALLGAPAPWHVKHDIAAVDRGMPADLRLNPDVEHARAVASSGDATLYAANLRDGGSCTELVTDTDRGRGATCTTAAEEAAQPIDFVAPADAQAAPDTPVAIGGRVNVDASRLEAVYADGAKDDVALGDDRYFVFAVPAAHLAAVHASGLDLVARDASGNVVGRATLPADWDDPAVPDEQAPLYVSTRSDESDLTKVYGVEGHVGAAGAVRLRLEYADGTQATIPVAADGSYTFSIPQAHVDDFMHPRELDALDADGRTVASAWVAAVAYWRGQNR